MSEKQVLFIIQGYEATQPAWLERLKKRFEVRVFDSPVEALDQARVDQPQAIWLEHHPSILTRHDLALILQTNFRTEHIPLFGPQAIQENPGAWAHKAYGVFYQSENEARQIEFRRFSSETAWTEIARSTRQDMVASQKKLRMTLVPGELELLPKEPALVERGAKIILTITEAKILSVLASHPKALIPRAALAKELAGLIPVSGSLRSIDVHVCALRKKSKSLRRGLRSVYGRGYELRFEKQKKSHQRASHLK